MTTIQKNNTPWFPAPKNIVGAPSRSTRSARCAMPTFAVSPRPSARARVYETSSDAASATKHASTAGVSRLADAAAQEVGGDPAEQHRLAHPVEGRVVEGAERRDHTP